MFTLQRREDGKRAEGPPSPAALCLREKRRVCVYVNKYLHDAQSSGYDSRCLCAARVRGRALRSVMAAFVDAALGTRRAQSSLGRRFRRPRAETLHLPAAARARSRGKSICAHACVQSLASVCVCVCTSMYV